MTKLFEIVMHTRPELSTASLSERPSLPPRYVKDCKYDVAENDYAHQRRARITEQACSVELHISSEAKNIAADKAGACLVAIKEPVTVQEEIRIVAAMILRAILQTVMSCRIYLTVIRCSSEPSGWRGPARCRPFYRFLRDSLTALALDSSLMS